MAQFIFWHNSDVTNIDGIFLEKKCAKATVGKVVAQFNFWHDSDVTKLAVVDIVRLSGSSISPPSKTVGFLHKISKLRDPRFTISTTCKVSLEQKPHQQLC